MRTRRVCLVAGLLLAADCRLPVYTTPFPGAPAESPTLPGAAVLVGAGDIGSCQSRGDERTAALVDSLLRAASAAGVAAAVFTVGDNAYPRGRAGDFRNCFGPSWGDTSRLIMTRLRPTPGNHEYLSSDAKPYFEYFGARAGDPGRGYYSYDVGAWHIVALNSVIAVHGHFSDADRAAQEEWLRADLAANPRRCTMAYFHHPRFSSGLHGGEPRTERLWTILFEAGVELIVNGHDHLYERFAPQTPAGVIDTVSGITQFIVGTGGGPLRSARIRSAANSEVRVQGHFGVLKLVLGDGEYRHAFIDTQRRLWDVGGGTCH